MVGPNRFKRAEILRDVSVNTVASARAWLVAMKWKTFQRLFFESSGKSSKRVSPTVVFITGLKPWC